MLRLLTITQNSATSIAYNNRPRTLKFALRFHVHAGKDYISVQSAARRGFSD